MGGLISTESVRKCQFIRRNTTSAHCFTCFKLPIERVFCHALSLPYYIQVYGLALELFGARVLCRDAGLLKIVRPSSGPRPAVLAFTELLDIADGRSES